MKLPREERNRILAQSAALARDVYATNKDLTDFEAFGDSDLFDEYPEDEHVRSRRPRAR